MSDISHWFARRRGIAVAIASCGNYVSGVIWPPLMEHFIDSRLAAAQWRRRRLLVLMRRWRWRMRRRAPAHAAGGAAAAGSASLGISRTRCSSCLHRGRRCCVAMAMPQVHIVAYCGDLGYGPARGAECCLRCWALA